MNSKNTIEYTALHGNNSVFSHDKGKIIYKKNLVLGDPICELKFTKEILVDFLKEFPNPTFFHITKTTADVLETLNFKINSFGSEHILKLTDFHPTWRSHKSLRRSINKSKRAGVTIKEVMIKDLNLTEFNDVDRSWIKQQKIPTDHVGFLLRPLSREDQEGVRTFAAFLNGRLIGFRQFCNGYADINRYHSTAPLGTSYYILAEAIKVFQNEGIQEIRLGLSPLYPLQEAFNYNILMRLFFVLLRRFGNFLFPFKGLYDHKIRFHGELRPLYVATQKWVPIGDVYRAFSFTFPGWRM